MDHRWRIELFGGLRLRCGDLVVTRFETRKTAALLACLALSLDCPQPRDVLAELLWPDEDLEATRDRLRHALMALRRVLEPPGTPQGSVLITNKSDIQFNEDLVDTDVREFERLLESAGAVPDAESRIERLQKATALYRGDLMPGCYEDCLEAERYRLADLYRDALSRLSVSLAEAGDIAGAIEAARRTVAADPLREDAHCHLMSLYSQAGRTSEALRQYRELERVLRQELDIVPSATSRSLAGRLQAEAATAGLPAASSGEAVPAGPTACLEPEGGAVPLGSAYYIARPQDAEFHGAVARGDSIVLVKGARLIGKTSLLARGLQQARQGGAQVALVDLQKLTPEQLESAESLFRTFADMIVDQLDLDISPEGVWNPSRGWNVNFERFLRREVLGRVSTALVWGLDEVDRLFGCPYRDVVFGLFRSWHNERSLNPDGPWGKLTLAIAYATEAHLFITDLNQSPFNVGTRVTLEDFTEAEVSELNRRYGSPLRQPADVARYVGLVGGNPYLVRRGLHTMVTRSLDLDRLEAEALDEEGLFGDHLRRMLSAVTHDHGLCEAVGALLSGGPCPSLDSFYRLRSAGIVTGRSQHEALFRCRVYEWYLERRLR